MNLLEFLVNFFTDWDKFGKGSMLILMTALVGMLYQFKHDSMIAMAEHNLITQKMFMTSESKISNLTITHDKEIDYLMKTDIMLSSGVLENKENVDELDKRVTIIEATRSIKEQSNNY